MPAAKRAVLLGHNFFPNLISYPMSVGLHSVFYLSLAMCLVAALASLLRGKAQIVTPETQNEAVQPSSATISNGNQSNYTLDFLIEGEKMHD